MSCVHRVHVRNPHYVQSFPWSRCPSSVGKHQGQAFIVETVRGPRDGARSVSAAGPAGACRGLDRAATLVDLTATSEYFDVLGKEGQYHTVLLDEPKSCHVFVP
jgi:hypothetical protein